MKNNSYLTICFISLLMVFVTCKKKTKEEEKPEPGVYGLSVDTSDNQLWMELLNPNETLFFKAHKYKESDAGYQNLFLNEFQLEDSSGDKQYRLRILTHQVNLDTGNYQTTDNNYNPFSDKVYVEFFRLTPSSKEKLFVSTLHQNDNFFNYQMMNTGYMLNFRILTHFSSPDRFAVLKGKFKIAKYQ